MSKVHPSGAEEEAPKQQDMLLDSRPDKKPVDWESVQRLASMPDVYDPPQLQAGWMGCIHRYCCFLNWYMHQSPLCAWPCIPCCCTSCFIGCSRCCGEPTEEHRISDPDDWFKKLLSTGTHPKCPKQLKGLYWMQDNHAHEVLSTFHDMDWKSSTLGLKRLSYNWSRSTTCWGSFSYLLHVLLKTQFRVEFSPDGKWMNLGYSQGQAWAYVVQEGDTFKTPDGEPVPMHPGEFIRINYKEEANVESGLMYLYRVRRVAYLDDEGNLVKTPAYEELLQRASEKTPWTSPCCGKYFVCMSSERAALKNWLQLSDRQFFALAPSAAAAPTIT